MARGARTSDEVREKIIAAYHSGESMGSIARMFNVGKSTVSGIIKSYKEEKPDEYEQIRTENAYNLIDKADDIANQILDLIIEKLKFTKDHKEALVMMKLSELTSAFGSIFDRIEVMRSRSEQETEGGVIEITKTLELKAPKDGDEIE